MDGLAARPQKRTCPKADLHMHEGEVGPVVDYIYEAAVRPELWRPALDRLAGASNALGAQMLYHRPEGAALHTVSGGLKEISEAFFREDWHINNSRQVRARSASRKS